MGQIGWGDGSMVTRHNKDHMVFISIKPQTTTD